MKSPIRALPNVLSILRIILSIALPFLDPSCAAFFACYLACGITDAIDGPLARRLGVAGRFGARLDSAGDLAFYAAVAVSIARWFLDPILRAVHPLAIILPVAAIAFVRFVSMAVVWKKTGVPGSIHTLANKATGLLVYASPLALAAILGGVGGHGAVGGAFAVRAICAVCIAAAFISALEELILACTAKTIDLDRKGIFFDRKP